MWFGAKKSDDYKYCGERSVFEETFIIIPYCDLDTYHHCNYFIHIATELLI